MGGGCIYFSPKRGKGLRREAPFRIEYGQVLPEWLQLGSHEAAGLAELVNAAYARGTLAPPGTRSGSE